MSYRPQLRIVNRDGSMGEILADAKGIGYLDDDSDVGLLTFTYPRYGTNSELLVPHAEVAVFVDGKELPNSRARVDQYAGNMIADTSALPVTWSGLTLLGRLDEALVLPAIDNHQREDVVTKAEEKALHKAMEEWMDSEVQKAKKNAKAKAKSYAESQAPKKKNNNPKAANNANVSALRNRAMSWAAGQVNNPSQSWYRLCQSFVRQSYGFPGIYGTAIEAWHAGAKRTGTPYSDIPAGVPVYFAPNHVVLSAGGGMCYSNDVCTSGRICKTSLSNISSGAWNLTYLGWSPECSGRTVYP